MSPPRPAAPRLQRLALVAAVVASAAALASADCGCTDDETCCKDDKDYVCCIDQATYCIPPNRSDAKLFPARCCPQWTVGCETGSVGCCDPARPWQRVLAGEKTRALAAHSHNSTGNNPVAAGAATVYALFTSGTKSDLNCLTIDAGTGAISKLVSVAGPAGAYLAKLYGEQTRIFPFDPTRGKFFFLDIVQQTASPKSPITLYGIDPADGKSTAKVVKGATGFVMSFVYHAESAKMLMATGVRDSPAFTFYYVDLDSAEATKVAVVPRGNTETYAGFYSPYMSAVASNGSSVFRLGYQEVVTAQKPGLGVTALSGNAQASWEAVPSAAGEEFFYSLVRQKGSDTFLSLAPSASSGHTLAVVEWDQNGAKVLLDIPDAHPPGTPQTGILGYVSDAANANTYVAMVVKKNPSFMGLKDKWEIVSVDLALSTGGSAVLTGKNFDLLGAETVSVSGIGIMK